MVLRSDRRPNAENQNEPDERRNDADDSADSWSDRKGFFRQHNQGQRRDPDEVHHAEDEQQRHERRAAAQTGQSVNKAKARSARPARPPKPHQKRHRRPAGVETGSLERRRLIEAGGDQESAANALIARTRGSFRRSPRS